MMAYWIFPLHQSARNINSFCNHYWIISIERLQNVGSRNRYLVRACIPSPPPKLSAWKFVYIQHSQRPENLNHAWGARYQIWDHTCRYLEECAKGRLVLEDQPYVLHPLSAVTWPSPFFFFAPSGIYQKSHINARGFKTEILIVPTANGRIPAIIDRTPTPEGKTREKRVFEGQAIMLYLCQKYDKDYKISFPFDSDKSVPYPLLS